MGEDALQAESKAVSIDPATSERPDVFTDGPFGELCEVVPGYCKIGVKDAAQVRELAALFSRGVAQDSGDADPVDGQR